MTVKASANPLFVVMFYRRCYEQIDEQTELLWHHTAPLVTLLNNVINSLSKKTSTSDINMWHNVATVTINNVLSMKFLSSCSELLFDGDSVQMSSVKMRNLPSNGFDNAL